MSRKLKSILLLDDNLATNFFHKKIIEKVNSAELILEFRSGINALNYLGQDGIELPELMMVDINMPIMSSWEFLEKFNEINKVAKTNTKVVLLSTSLSPADKEKADKLPLIKEILLKPLTKESIQAVIDDIIT